VVFYLIGYNLGYGNAGEGGYIGTLEIWSDSSSLETGYSDASDWFFQALFVCATASIVSGAVAERIKIWPFFIFSAILGGIIYPIQMGWEWGGGWLDALGFADFAWINFSSRLWWCCCISWCYITRTTYWKIF
jgi:Amt family ammonium transporter